MNDNTALFIFDFDGTLVKSSLHNYIGQRLWECITNIIKGRFFQSDKERDQVISELTRKISIELTKDFLADDKLGWKNPEEVKLLMKKILICGHKIGIATFNDYPYAVKYALEQLLGKEDAEKLHIESGLPAYKYEEIQLCTKEPYIKRLMNKTEITEKANIFFMDDDKKHVAAAEKFGIKAVLVTRDGHKHIDLAFETLKKLNIKCGIDVNLEYPITKPEFDQYYLAGTIGFDPIDKDWFENSSKMLGEC